jgi:hypothetical protein
MLTDSLLCEIRAEAEETVEDLKITETVFSEVPTEDEKT